MKGIYVSYTAEQQGLIDGVEFALDNGIEITEEEYREYCRLLADRRVKE